MSITDTDFTRARHSTFAPEASLLQRSRLHQGCELSALYEWLSYVLRVVWLDEMSYIMLRINITCQILFILHIN